MSDARTHTAWLLWCISEGYAKAEDRSIVPNWLEKDPMTLHDADAALRPHLLAMADEVLAAADKRYEKLRTVCDSTIEHLESEVARLTAERNAAVREAGPVGKLQAERDGAVDQWIMAEQEITRLGAQLAEAQQKYADAEETNNRLHELTAGDWERIRREAIGASDDLQTAVGLNAVFDVMATDSHRRSELWFPRVHSELDRLLAHLAMGVAGEAGEACDEVKKVLRDAKYDFTKVGQELADALTYIVMLGQLIGLDWELAIDHMIVKCENRWGALAAGESAVTGEAT